MWGYAVPATCTCIYRLHLNCRISRTYGGYPGRSTYVGITVDFIYTTFAWGCAVTTTCTCCIYCVYVYIAGLAGQVRISHTSEVCGVDPDLCAVCLENTVYAFRVGVCGTCDLYLSSRITPRLITLHHVYSV